MLPALFAPRWRVVETLVLCLPLLLGVAAHTGPTPVVERISFTRRADGQGLVVRLHVEGRVQAYGQPRWVQPGQVELVLFNTRLAPGFRKASPLAPIKTYTVETRKGHLVVRLRLDGEQAFRLAAYRDRESPDVLMGLEASSAAEADAAAPGRAETLATARRRWMLDTIVLDAGHGGRDDGAVAHGLREKDITLAVARRLGGMLEELGLKVVYTRGSDRFVELSRRGVIANEAGGKLFLSIHVNAAKNHAASGTETFFLGMHKTDAARDVMERENSVVRLEGNPEAYENLTEESLILQTLANSAYMRKSEQLAGLVEETFEGAAGRKSRGVKQAGFYVLWRASMPAVLIELGFLSNAREAEFLGSEQGQATLARAIFRSVRAFKERYEKDLDVASDS